MNYVLVIVFNFVVTIVNLIAFIYLTRWRKSLKSINEQLELADGQIQVSLRQVSLQILLTTLEIQQYKYKYQGIKNKISQVRKFIIVTRYLSGIYQKRFKSVLTTNSGKL